MDNVLIGRADIEPESISIDVKSELKERMNNITMMNSYYEAFALLVPLTVCA